MPGSFGRNRHVMDNRVQSGSHESWDFVLFGQFHKGFLDHILSAFAPPPGMQDQTRRLSIKELSP